MLVCLLALAFAVSICIGSLNAGNQTVVLNLPGNSIVFPLWPFFLTTGAAGLLLGYFYRQRTNQGQGHKQWQAQDAKLIAELKTDREKQLEAKIATLETALKQALKKS